MKNGKEARQPRDRLRPLLMDLIEVPEAKNIQNGEVTIFEELMAEDIPELKGKISSSM